MSTPVTCQDVRMRLAAYLAGDLPEAQALAVEAHAAECAACEALLDDATRVPVDAFAPALPPEVRARTLAAAMTRDVTTNVASGDTSPAAGHRATRWVAAVATLAAAAALVLTLREEPAPAIPRADSTLAVAATDVSPDRLADVTAQPEFAELERAANELKAELTKAPGDAELEAFLEAVNTRRMELERRVKDARS